MISSKSKSMVGSIVHKITLSITSLNSSSEWSNKVTILNRDSINKKLSKNYWVTLGKLNLNKANQIRANSISLKLTNDDVYDNLIIILWLSKVKKKQLSLKLKNLILIIYEFLIDFFLILIVRS